MWDESSEARNTNQGQLLPAVPAGRAARPCPLLPRGMRRGRHAAPSFPPGGSADERLLVDVALRQLAQPLVRLLFLLQRPFEQRDVLALAEQLGVGAHRAVAGDLVVLHPLRGG